jgi:hypothetical protein
MPAIPLPLAGADSGQIPVHNASVNLNAWKNVGQPRADPYLSANY